MRYLLTRSKMMGDSLSAHLASKLSTSLHSKPMCDYEEVMKVLNSLRSNASVLDSYRRQGKRTHLSQAQNLEETVKYLSRSGMSLEQLDELSVIHVSGTKGKGSTCAFCESILRHHDFKTGFYTSPHLVAVRERIQINGKPLTRQAFSKYFWPVYDSLYSKREHEHDMPTYFKFLTIMAFHVFIAEKVDVALIEVGIGGEHDCTNVLRHVTAVGITSLGMDHTSLLGSCIEDIAWQKAGIFKMGAPAFTVQQPMGAWPVLQRRAVERSCCLKIAPPLELYDWSYNCSKLHFSCSIQALNASLALQLANAWLKQRDGNEKYKFAEIDERRDAMAAGFPVTPHMLKGLSSCSWPGRLQMLHRGSVTYFLDGAHTVESISACAQWFVQASLESEPGKLHKRVLVFNVTGERQVLDLLKPLRKCQFDDVIFCPNIVGTVVDVCSDNANFAVPGEQLRCGDMQRIWNNLQDEMTKVENSEDATSRPCNNSNTSVQSCVDDTLSYIERNAATANHHTHVLVTGSLHLVGCVLTVLDPDLSTPSLHCIPK